MIHGERDYTVEADQTKLMDAELSRAGKPHETVYVEATDHFFREDPALRKLLETLADFLSRQLGGAPAP